MLRYKGRNQLHNIDTGSGLLAPQLSATDEAREPSARNQLQLWWIGNWQSPGHNARPPLLKRWINSPKFSVRSQACGSAHSKTVERVGRFTRKVLPHRDFDVMAIGLDQGQELGQGVQQETSGHGSLAGAAAPAAAADGQQQLQPDGAALDVISCQEDRTSGGSARPARPARQYEPLLLNGPGDSAVSNGESFGGGDSGNGEGQEQSPARAKKAVTFSSVVEVWGLSNQSSFISEESDDEAHLKQVIASSIIGNTLVS